MESKQNDQLIIKKKKSAVFSLQNILISIINLLFLFTFYWYMTIMTKDKL